MAVVSCMRIPTVILFVFVVVGLFVWNISRRKERPPEKFKLLRGPGETLRRRVQKADEDMFQWLGAAAIAPALIGCAVFLGVAYLPKSWHLGGAGVTVLAFVGSLVSGVLLLFHFLHRRRNDFLGDLGERAVTESLDPLIAQGYRVFHDVQEERLQSRSRDSGADGGRGGRDEDTKEEEGARRL